MQLLLALYFFLAGIAVTMRQQLVVMPLASGVFALVLWGAGPVASRLIPGYR